MIHLATHSVYHLVFDALAWAAGISVGLVIYGAVMIGRPKGARLESL